jgi:hypothetical protein
MSEERETVDDTLARIDRGELTTRPEQRGAFDRGTGRPADIYERIRERIMGPRTPSSRDTGRRPTR